MKLLMASDHGGYRLKEHVRKYLEDLGIEVDDLGPFSEESVDYPDFAVPVASRICSGEVERAILICGTGIGMSITANRFPGVRATQVTDEFTAEMSRRHNDSNVLVLGGRVTDEDMAERIVKIWLGTPFDGGRHTRRLEKISELEKRLGGGDVKGEGS